MTLTVVWTCPEDSPCPPELCPPELCKRLSARVMLVRLVVLPTPDAVVFDRYVLETSLLLLKVMSDVRIGD